MKQVNENITSLNCRVNELTTSVEFSQKEVEDLKEAKKEYKQLMKTNNEVMRKLKEDLQAREKCIVDLEERVNYQEDYSRRSNVHIFGMEEREEETWEQTCIMVRKLCEEKLQLPDIQLERAHRVGQRNHQRSRPFIARFMRFADREAVMRNVAKLRGTRIFINEDLCAASQALRKSQLPLLKQARSDGKTAYFRYTKLIIKEKSSVTGGALVRGGAPASGHGVASEAGFGTMSVASASGATTALDHGIASFGTVSGTSVRGETSDSDRDDLKVDETSVPAKVSTSGRDGTPTVSTNVDLSQAVPSSGAVMEVSASGAWRSPLGRSVDGAAAAATLRSGGSKALVS